MNRASTMRRDGDHGRRPAQRHAAAAPAAGGRSTGDKVPVEAGRIGKRRFRRVDPLDLLARAALLPGHRRSSSELVVDEGRDAFGAHRVDDQDRASRWRARPARPASPHPHRDTLDRVRRRIVEASCRAGSARAAAASAAPARRPRRRCPPRKASASSKLAARKKIQPSRTMWKVTRMPSDPRQRLPALRPELAPQPLGGEHARRAARPRSRSSSSRRARGRRAASSSSGRGRAGSDRGASRPARRRDSRAASSTG